jgi:MoxR-like ATPase
VAKATRTTPANGATVTPAQLAETLSTVVTHGIDLSVMLWGAPGIGKSSIVAQVAAGHGLELIDLRLSQLAPTDLRGLPVADHERGISRWYPPEFLPREGRGVLFLDEINMAPPSLQGIAQQLILDRRVGSCRVPEGWFIWAAGNRKEDLASVFDMPAPLANRFIHLEVGPDLESFKRYALAAALAPDVVAFLAFRPHLLHALDPVNPNWPSPRSWAMASRLHQAGLSVGPAVGPAAAAEFEAFVLVCRGLPDLRAVLQGSASPPFPTEPSARYAAVIGLAASADTADQVMNGLGWLLDAAP